MRRTILANDTFDDDEYVAESLQTLIDQIKSVARVAGEMCVRRSEPALNPSAITAEDMWFRLLAGIVRLVKTVNSFCSQPSMSPPIVDRDVAKDGILHAVRSLLPDTLASLVALPSSSSRRAAISFPRLVRRLLDSSIASPSASEFRPLISGMLDAYRYETDILRSTLTLVEADLFEDVSKLKVQRSHGWHPSSIFPICRGCGDPITTFQTVTPSNKTTTVEVLEKLSPTRERPSLVKRPSVKGKEVLRVNDAREREMEADEARLKHSNRIVVSRDGKVYHPNCFEAVRESQLMAPLPSSPTLTVDGPF